jgi:hypothetical protein
MDRELQAKLLEAALEYAGRGLPVFPCNGKKPHTQRGFQDASTDTATVLAWWQRWPEANIGIPTGATSGLDVLDVDVQHGGGGELERLQRERGKLPATVEVLTPSGGRHYWFAHKRALRSSAGILGPGVDTRGEGGYVVVPPSVGENGRAYKFMSRGRLSVDMAELPGWVLELLDGERRRNGPAPKVADFIPEGKRRAAMLTVAGKLKRTGLSGEEILPSLRELNKRCKPPLDETELESVAFKSTIGADPETAIRTVAEAEARPIEAVLETFRAWLYLPDPAPVLVTCAAVAANRVESFDPTWLVLIGAAGSGKTEALNATTALENVYLAGTLTEAALLSGTPRKDTAVGASGGLLREIGSSGILILKDFGSILSMHREQRANVLAALREIYDGSWHRDVGVDGGRRLHWEGRIGLLAGATTVLDQHHGVMSQLGERFLLHRLTVEDPGGQGRASLAHHGRERAMRRELAEAVAGLFAGLGSTEPHGLAPADTDRLVDLAVLVARARSPVVRDSYRREIELVPDSEAPGRIVGALARILTGLRLIGVNEREAWRLTVKTGLDSMPAARLEALEFLLEHDEASTTDIATALGLPNPTTHRTLGDLAAHGVLIRKPQGQGKADLWLVEPTSAALYRAATTSSEMSEPPI